jgi:glycosyltransferase involved in cell wall biosynthesis
VAQKKSIAVYVCTFRRNEPLRRMLDSLAVAAERVQPEAEVAVVVIDDNPDGRAKEVVAEYPDPFARGLHYRYSGAKNISHARNTGLEAAAELADWVAMVDDDQVVAEGWFEALLDVQQRTGCDAVTGPVILRYPHGCPPWMLDQPFTEILEAKTHPDGAEVQACSTGNSMLRTSFLREHPGIRFRADLGRLGGEDMVFYAAAIGAGLDARYSTEAVSYGEQPPERSTYRYLVRTSYWMGNTEYLTNFESGVAGRVRLGLRGAKRLLAALTRPFRQMAGGQPAQWRYGGASLARSFGMLVGVIGIKVAHK